MAPKARPPGTGRKARAKRRKEELANGGKLLSAVAYHGHTSPGRLRLLNLFLKLSFTSDLFDTQEARNNCPVVLDIGFGDEPTTTLELHAQLSPGVQVVATEADASRLDRACSMQLKRMDEHGGALPGGKAPIRFCQTGTDFTLPTTQKDEELRLVIAMNVLRDYHAWDAAAALARLWAQLPPGSSMIEGSCNIEGSRLAAVVLRGGESTLSGFVFAADVTGSGARDLTGPPPSWFDWFLPRVWLKSGADGGLDGLRENGNTSTNAVRRFLEAWGNAAEGCNREGCDGADPAAWLKSSALRLKDTDPRVDVTLVDHGIVVWWARQVLPSYHPKSEQQEH